MNEAKKEINLKVLQLHLTNVVDIILTTSHVAVYNFDQQEQVWTKRGIEGTLFVFQRSVAPYYGIFVINRLSTENLVFLIYPDLQCQILDHYLMYKHNDQVFGIWIFENDDRERLLQVLTEYQFAKRRCKDAASPTTKSSLSMQEIWSTLDGMGPTKTKLTEVEFMNRFHALVASPLFVRAMYLSYLSDRASI